MNATEKAGNPSVTAETPRPAIDQTFLRNVQELLRDAQAGNSARLPELRKLLDAHPEVWGAYGDLAHQVLATWVKLISGSNLLLSESLNRKLQAMRAELSGPDPSPLEKLLVERVLACHLHVYHADAMVVETTNATPGQHRALQDRLTGAQHRFLKAIKALATLRKLIKPPISPVEIATRSMAETTPKATTPGHGAGRIRAAAFADMGISN
ncbi:hypothetical protein AYO40_02320 [Planctomycetaceae bacterium SCGC AG-212-D15]|nr:hypothetical protein AYO40_02320 [Planctomycetaceae bacterium SCGC AG-212-D15]